MGYELHGLRSAQLLNQLGLDGGHVVDQLQSGRSPAELANLDRGYTNVSGFGPQRVSELLRTGLIAPSRLAPENRRLSPSGYAPGNMPSWNSNAGGALNRFLAADPFARQQLEMALGGRIVPQAGNPGQLQVVPFPPGSAPTVGNGGPNLGVRRADETYQVLCRVGGGFSDEQRREILSDLKDLVVESEYAEVNSDRVAYQMVRPEWVIEISYLDLVAQTTRGGSINRMVLEYQSDESPAYKVVRRLPLTAVISPQFVRRREDKQADSTDVRIEQIAERVDLSMADQDARQLKLPASSMMQREVFVKELKGATMVRKFIMWRTNKSDQSDEFPEFVIHYTDFSPNRKQPLDREIRVTNSQEQAEMLWNHLKKQNIKSGWQPAETTAPAVDAVDDTPASQPKKRMAPSERTKKAARRKKSS